MLDFHKIKSPHVLLAEGHMGHYSSRDSANSSKQQTPWSQYNVSMIFVIVPSLIIYVWEGTIHTNSFFISFGLQIVFQFQKLEQGVT